MISQFKIKFVKLRTIQDPPLEQREHFSPATTMMGMISLWQASHDFFDLLLHARDVFSTCFSIIGRSTAERSLLMRLLLLAVIIDNETGSLRVLLTGF